MLGLKPKDYDIATNATPEEVRRLFRRSRIIGRRFRLVHVISHNETVEVSTFRGNTSHDLAQPHLAGAQTDADGRLLHDNIFGSQEEDVMRRDFTINALFYDPKPRKSLIILMVLKILSQNACRLSGIRNSVFARTRYGYYERYASLPSLVFRSMIVPLRPSEIWRHC